jgi:hypothetical protein
MIRKKERIHDGKNGDRKNERNGKEVRDAIQKRKMNE